MLLMPLIGENLELFPGLRLLQFPGTLDRMFGKLRGPMTGVLNMLSPLLGADNAESSLLRNLDQLQVSHD